ncbi:hypothetical protein B7494_g2307 [Chlorociboria aeruginascens]|nr:hypothetical protein B7494_g2307 [Chlorociboria aeruginascens]
MCTQDHIHYSCRCLHTGELHPCTPQQLNPSSDCLAVVKQTLNLPQKCSACRQFALYTRLDKTWLLNAGKRKLETRRGEWQKDGRWWRYKLRERQSKERWKDSGWDAASRGEGLGLGLDLDLGFDNSNRGWETSPLECDVTNEVSVTREDRSPDSEDSGFSVSISAGEEEGNGRKTRRSRWRCDESSSDDEEAETETEGYYSTFFRDLTGAVTGEGLRRRRKERSISEGSILRGGGVAMQNELNPTVDTSGEGDPTLQRRPKIPRVGGRRLYTTILSPQEPADELEFLDDYFGQPSEHPSTATGSMPEKSRSIRLLDLDSGKEEVQEQQDSISAYGAEKSQTPRSRMMVKEICFTPEDSETEDCNSPETATPPQTPKLGYFSLPFFGNAASSPPQGHPEVLGSYFGPKNPITTTRRSLSTPITPSRIPVLQTPTLQSAKPPVVIARAVATWRWEGGEVLDLGFEVGDEIDVYRYRNEEWCLGKNLRTGEEGVFPKGCVEVEAEDSGKYTGMSGGGSVIKECNMGY